MITTRGMGAGFGSVVVTSGLGAGYGSAPPVVPATPAGGGWAQQLDINARWRKRQDEEWVILHG